MTESKAVNGHGCGGCYVRWEYEGMNLCKSKIVNGGVHEWPGGGWYRNISFRVIQNDLSIRPDWCPLNE